MRKLANAPKQSMDAQAQHDAQVPGWLEKLQQETPERQAASKQTLEALITENAAPSSSATSSLPTDLVGLVSRRHGVTRERAIEPIEEFWG